MKTALGAKQGDDSPHTPNSTGTESGIPSSLAFKPFRQQPDLFHLCVIGSDPFSCCSGSGSFSLSGPADLFLGVPPVNGGQSGYQMGMQVGHTIDHRPVQVMLSG